MNITTYITNKCKFVARDLDKTSSENKIFVEFLYGKNIPSNSTVQIGTTYQEYSYNLPKDGLIRYLKLEVSLVSDGNNVYWDGNQLINGEEPITEISDILEYLDETSKGITVCADIDTFCICHLQTCVSELQRKTIFNGIKNCNLGKCDQQSIDKLHRDFLYISLVVLDNLICQKKYYEAESILNGLASCNSLCPNVNIKSNCNCQ